VTWLFEFSDFDRVHVSGQMRGTMTDGRSEPGPPDDEKPEIERLIGELADMRDRWMRSEAEIANVRARAARSIEEMRDFAIQKFAGDVVEAAENLRRGLESLPAATAVEPKNITGLRAGLGEIERSFVTTLERNGIKKSDPTGIAFRPDVHQAVGEQEASGYAPGTVLQTLSPTWTLNGRLLRPAMVVVAKSSQEKANAPAIHVDRTV